MMQDAHWEVHCADASVGVENLKRLLLESDGLVTPAVEDAITETKAELDAIIA